MLEWCVRSTVYTAPSFLAIRHHRRRRPRPPQHPRSRRRSRPCRRCRRPANRYRLRCRKHHGPPTWDRVVNSHTVVKLNPRPPTCPRLPPQSFPPRPVTPPPPSLPAPPSSLLGRSSHGSVRYGCAARQRRARRTTSRPSRLVWPSTCSSHSLTSQVYPADVRHPLPIAMWPPSRRIVLRTVHRLLHLHCSTALVAAKPAATRLDL